MGANLQWISVPTFVVDQHFKKDAEHRFQNGLIRE